MEEDNSILDGERLFIIQLVNSYIQPHITIDQAKAAKEFLEELALLCGNYQKFWGLITLIEAGSHSAYEELILLGKKALVLYLEDQSTEEEDGTNEA